MREKLLIPSVEDAVNNESRKTQYQPMILPLNTDEDLVKIREYGRTLAADMGFNEKDQTIISTAISEICRNVIQYAGEGEVTIGPAEDSEGIEITMSDDGPGIKDVDKALQEGYSKNDGLGIGLPGAKRIMDEFEIETKVGEGTTIRMYKWLDNSEL